MHKEPCYASLGQTWASEPHSLRCEACSRKRHNPFPETHDINRRAGSSTICDDEGLMIAYTGRPWIANGKEQQCLPLSDTRQISSLFVEGKHQRSIGHRGESITHTGSLWLSFGWFISLPFFIASNIVSIPLTEVIKHALRICH